MRKRTGWSRKARPICWKRRCNDSILRSIRKELLENIKSFLHFHCIQQTIVNLFGQDGAKAPNSLLDRLYSSQLRRDKEKNFWIREGGRSSCQTSDASLQSRRMCIQSSCWPSQRAHAELWASPLLQRTSFESKRAWLNSHMKNLALAWTLRCQMQSHTNQHGSKG